jgi:hypothetical protein
VFTVLLYLTILCLEEIKMKTLEQKRKVYKQIVKGGQGNDEIDLVYAAISTLIVCSIGCVLMVGLWIFGFIK